MFQMHHLTKHMGKLSTLQHIINLITFWLTLTPTSFLKETCFFTGELGGSIGLLLGASAVSLIEILDVILYNFFLMRKQKRQARRKKATGRGINSHNKRTGGNNMESGDVYRSEVSDYRNALWMRGTRGERVGTRNGHVTSAVDALQVHTGGHTWSTELAK